jgi:hypothetical protein
MTRIYRNTAGGPTKAQIPVANWRDLLRSDGAFASECQAPETSRWPGATWLFAEMLLLRFFAISARH